MWSFIPDILKRNKTQAIHIQQNNILPKKSIKHRDSFDIYLDKKTNNKYIENAINSVNNKVKEAKESNEAKETNKKVEDLLKIKDVINKNTSSSTLICDWTDSSDDYSEICSIYSESTIDCLDFKKNNLSFIYISLFSFSAGLAFTGIGLFLFHHLVQQKKK